MSAEDMGDYKEFPTKESALDWLDNYLSLDERNNLIRALQQEPILDKIRAEIETKYGQCDICEYDSDYCGWNQVGDIAGILQIIDKYKAETEE